MGTPTPNFEPGNGNYFDNALIFLQFEKLFILLQFKKWYKNHEIEFIVDNARPHTAKLYDIYVNTMIDQI